MDKRKALIASGVTVVALLGGTGAVLAGGADDDKPLTGSAYDKATQAAIEHVGGGEAIETEVGDDGAAYGVEVRKDDGSVVEVNLDENFNVTSSEGDDDGPNDDGSNDDGPEDD